MKILLVNQFFWPDSAATSQLLTDVARKLAELGHDVQVLCGSGAYASHDVSEQPLVRIRRTPALTSCGAGQDAPCPMEVFLRPRSGRVFLAPGRTWL